jgi:hypothetical protein
MVRIMASWTGLTKRYTFDRWAAYYKKCVHDRVHHAERKAQSEKLEMENKIAMFELAKWELSKWSEHMDVFSDTPFWQNDRGVIVRVEPNLQDYLPDDYKLVELGSLINDNADKTKMLLDDTVSEKGKDLILKTARQQVADRVSARESARSDPAQKSARESAYSNRSQKLTSRSNLPQPDIVRSNSGSSLPPIRST